MPNPRGGRPSDRRRAVSSAEGRGVEAQGAEDLTARRSGAAAQRPAHLDVFESSSWGWRFFLQKIEFRVFFLKIIIFN